MLAFEKEQAQQQPSKPLVAQTMIWKWDCVSCFACSGANENPPSRLRALNSGTFEPFEDAPPPCYPRNHSCASPKLQAICQTLDQALSECHLNCSELLLPYLVPELGPWSLADQLGTNFARSHQAVYCKAADLSRLDALRLRRRQVQCAKRSSKSSKSSKSPNWNV